MGARHHLSEAEAKDALARYGVAVPERRVAAGKREALAALRELRTPVAVKLISEVLHKSDVGGVKLGVADAEALAAAIDAIDEAAASRSIEVEGYLVEEMAAAGVEVIVGGLVDPVFGPAVLVGLGGIYAEILDDVALRICPISTADALEMIGDLRAAPLLFGARGRPAVAVDALASVLVALGGSDGYLMSHADRVAEVDLNPVIVSTTGAVVVDARVVFRQEAPGAA